MIGTTVCRKCKKAINRSMDSVLTIGKTKLCKDCLSEWNDVRHEAWDKWITDRKIDNRGMNAVQMGQKGLLIPQAQKKFDEQRS